ncbi:unnamed protein product [Orchesella dallaii]|uniref:EB domain-containing protein n=1 Tax=Orchesella dallaii TaxID=48710 RepID=A0ABP1QSD8_9HEXA
MCGVQTLCVTDVFGSPMPERGQAKPPNCPHGQCFIDRCKNICSCIPNTGEKVCPKLNFVANFFMDSLDCTLSPDAGNCPHGETYKDEIWPDYFLCYCNHDVSQTYVCYDLNSNSTVDAAVLTKFRLGLEKQVREKAIGQK